MLQNFIAFVKFKEKTTFVLVAGSVQECSWQCGGGRGDQPLPETHLTHDTH